MTEYAQDYWFIDSIVNRINEREQKGWEFVSFIGTQFNRSGNECIWVLFRRPSPREEKP
jgi:hypothetical protein